MVGRYLSKIEEFLFEMQYSPHSNFNLLKNLCKILIKSFLLKKRDPKNITFTHTTSYIGSGHLKQISE